jgi:hypothetical protein
MNQGPPVSLGACVRREERLGWDLLVCKLTLSLLFLLADMVVEWRQKRYFLQCILPTKLPCPQSQELGVRRRQQGAPK